MFPIDRRKLAFHIYSLLHSLRKTARLVQVHASTICRWLKEPERKQYQRSKPTKSEQIIGCLRSTITSNPFTTVRKLKSIIQEVLKIDVSIELVRTVILKLGFSRKKARFFSKPNDLEYKTQKFIDQRNEFIQKGYCIYSVDETSFGRNTKDVLGYAPKGIQLRIPRARPRMTTVSSLALMNKSSIVLHQEQTKPHNTSSFLDFLKQCNLSRTSVILLDNVSFHHSKVVKEYAAEVGIHLLYTPPYSPWFNPIEGIFSIVKRRFYQGMGIKEAYAYAQQHHCSAFMQKALSCVLMPC
jgi:transposase